VDLCEWIPVKGKMEISLIDIPEAVPPDLQEQIESLWKAESQKRELEDRKILSLVAIRPQRIICRTVDYKSFFAQTLLPELNLRICPIAVCGITRQGDQYLVGKRSKNVLQYPEMYEFVPSGSLDAADPVPEKQILKELQEECGIEKSHVNGCVLKLIIHNLTTPLMDFCYLIDVGEASAKPSSEYPEIFRLNEEEILKSFLDHNWVPYAEQIFRKTITP